MYHLKIKTSSKEWIVTKRYLEFKELHESLHKNRLYMKKIPDLPPKRLLKKSKEVMEERIRELPSKFCILNSNFNCL